MEPTFFATAAEFRKWLEKNHDKADELQVGFYKRASGRPSMTWSEAVDQALCFGWIDGVRHGIDQISYMNRFTPRRPGSNWSAVNIQKVQELRRRGLMHPAGEVAFERRSDKKTGIYSYEQRYDAALDRDGERRFKSNKAAWAWFQKQPPSYRQTAIYWVMSAKREETRRRRLDQLIADSAGERRIGPMARPTPKKA